MKANSFKTVSSATLALFREITREGTQVYTKRQTVKQVTPNVMEITSPLYRHLTLVGRKNNPFAAMYETLWVLSGSNDISGLNFFIRASDFSDDGSTWRAGYGPRLRNYNGVDQVEEVIRKLTDNRQDRQAVISIFDASVDHSPSKDIPCNNWLSFMVNQETGALDLCIAVRSNDLIWGFSGINSFEWSCLQQMIAEELNVPVGKQTWLQANLHVYERHWGLEMSEDSTGRFGPDILFTPNCSAGYFASLVEGLNCYINHPFEVRSDPLKLDSSYAELYVDLVACYIGIKQGLKSCENRMLSYIKALKGTDLGWSIEDYCSRCFGLDVSDEALSDLKANICQLHTDKGRIYGNSWCNRGPLLSIWPNILRKSDRLGVYLDSPGSSEDVESLEDTITDLLVYLLKYYLWLESDGMDEMSLGFDEALSDLLPIQSRHLHDDLRIIVRRLNGLADRIEDDPDFIVNSEVIHNLCQSTLGVLVRYVYQ